MYFSLGKIIYLIPGINGISLLNYLFIWGNNTRNLNQYNINLTRNTQIYSFTECGK